MEQLVEVIRSILSWSIAQSTATRAMHLTTIHLTLFTISILPPHVPIVTTLRQLALRCTISLTDGILAHRAPIVCTIVQKSIAAHLQSLRSLGAV